MRQRAYELSLQWNGGIFFFLSGKRPNFFPFFFWWRLPWNILATLEASPNKILLKNKLYTRTSLFLSVYTNIATFNCNLLLSLPRTLAPDAMMGVQCTLVLYWFLSVYTYIVTLTATSCDFRWFLLAVWKPIKTSKVFRGPTDPRTHPQTTDPPTKSRMEAGTLPKKK